MDDIRFSKKSILIQNEPLLALQNYFNWYIKTLITHNITNIFTFAIDLSNLFLFQFLFKRYLSGKQWLSLVILTFGCMLQSLDVSQKTDKSLDDDSKTESDDVTWWILVETSTGIILILVQVKVIRFKV